RAGLSGVRPREHDPGRDDRARQADGRDVGGGAHQNRRRRVPARAPGCPGLTYGLAAARPLLDTRKSRQASIAAASARTTARPLECRPVARPARRVAAWVTWDWRGDRALAQLGAAGRGRAAPPDATGHDDRRGRLGADGKSGWFS